MPQLRFHRQHIEDDSALICIAHLGIMGNAPLILQQVGLPLDEFALEFSPNPALGAPHYLGPLLLSDAGIDGVELTNQYPPVLEPTPVRVLRPVVEYKLLCSARCPAHDGHSQGIIGGIFDLPLRDGVAGNGLGQPLCLLHCN